MKLKILTIAIPTYNGGKTLIEAIESCKYIKLPHDEFEVLVLNNCSDDDSIVMAKQEFKDFKPLRIIDNDKNYGRIGNWNRCLEFADGEFLLFLFTNDLIEKDNHVSQVLSLMKKNSECSLINMPWIVSNFDQSKKTMPPQFYLRTPGYEYYECMNHIKSVVEMGKLPFVPLQSNIIRLSTIKQGGIQFDTSLPITSDGLFLTQLATETNLVGFYEKPSIIWRFDAPTRMHAHIKLNEHNQQLLKSFSLIDKLLNKKINLAKAFSKGKGIENILVSIIAIRNKQDVVITKQVITDWLHAVGSYKINMKEFIFRTIWEILKLPLKFRTLVNSLINVNK